RRAAGRLELERRDLQGVAALLLVVVVPGRAHPQPRRRPGVPGRGRRRPRGRPGRLAAARRDPRRGHGRRGRVRHRRARRAHPRREVGGATNTSPVPAPVPVEDRLFSLVLALVATESGLTKTEILSSVRGYAQRYVAGGDNANLERQFERDKDDIRELGVPLETIEPLGEPGDNHNLRYRIPKGAYDLPDDVRFDSEELALLGLAAMAWREGSLSAESRRALVKLRALGIAADEPILGYAPRLRLRDAAFEPLQQAIDRRQLVTFDYLKPGEDRARTREVIPLALVQYEGRWHLTAEELATGESRTFLLRRIVGKVTAGKPAPERLGDHVSRSPAVLDAGWGRRVRARGV